MVSEKILAHLWSLLEIIVYPMSAQSKNSDASNLDLSYPVWVLG